MRLLARVGEERERRWERVKKQQKKGQCYAYERWEKREKESQRGAHAHEEKQNLSLLALL